MQITPHTETQMDALLARIERAAEQGYAVVTNETVMGDISVAAPITDLRGVAVIKPELLDELKEAFLLLKPVYRFFMRLD